MNSRTSMTNITRLLPSLILAAGSVLCLVPGVAHAAQTYSTAEQACTPGESWIFSTSIPDAFGKAFTSSLDFQVDPKKEIKSDSRQNPYEFFVQAQALKARANTPELQAMSDYWVGRIFYQLGQYHLAHAQLNSFASRKFQPAELGFQLAALDCLERIKENHAALKLDNAVAAQMAQLPWMSFSPAQKDVVRRVAFQYLRQESARLSAQAETATADPTTAALSKFLADSGTASGKDTGAVLYDAFFKGMAYYQQGKMNESVVEFRKIVAQDKRPPLIEKSMDLIYLSYGRALYTAGKYVESADILRKVPKSSNYLGQSLSDLSWALLMSGKYKEAIGTAYNLQRSALKHVFLPEGPMVMAISLNEMCQFQRAIQAVRFFRKRYKDNYTWLKAWLTKADKNSYSQLVSQLKGGKEVPDEIATEWLRSPIFAAQQEEINLLRDERVLLAKLIKLGFRDILVGQKEIPVLRKNMTVYQSKKLSGQGKDKMNRTALRLGQVERRVAASQLWDRTFRTFATTLGARDQAAVDLINADLAARNRKMADLLRKVDENTEFVEIEIMDGASEDMVWRNAHPDYKVVSQKFKEEQAKKSRKAVWSWGTSAEADEKGEVWEDELGWYSDDIGDECSNKNRYLSVKAAD